MVVLAFEVLFVLCIISTLWFVGYVVYRLVSDDSGVR